MRKRRIIVNNDYYNIFQVNPPVTDQDIYDAVDKMVEPAAPGSQVDSLFLLVDEGLKPMLAPEVTRLYEHPDTDPCMNSLAELKAAGKDPWAMVVGRAKEKGLEIFASVRMNDTHYKDHPFHYWMEQFYYDNLHNRVSLSLASGQRGMSEFDYRKSAVRDYYLDIIKRNAEKYDIDGVEMDFTRNCIYFPDPNREECAPVMTEFVRQVRETLDEIGNKKGKRLLLAATTPYSLYRTRLEGVDIPAMARLGLIDILCLSSPWNVDFDRDIADTRLKVPGMQVYAGCDRNLPGWPARQVPMQTYRAMAASYLRQGADGTYLYNVMHWTMRLDNPPEELKLFGGGALTVHDANLMSEVGELATLDRLDKLYLVSQHAETPDKPYAALPVTVPAEGEVTLRLFIGDDIAKAAKKSAIERIYVQAISSDCADYGNWTIKLNGVDLSRQYAFMPYATQPDDRYLFPEPYANEAPVPLAQVRRHAVAPINVQTGTNFITLKSYREAMTITDVEVAIIYRK